MGAFLTKKLPMLFAALFVATTSISADCHNRSCEKEVKAYDPCDTCQEKLKPYDQGHALCEGSLMGAYNSPARIDVRNCWDIYVTGTYIYWEARQKGMELGNYASTENQTKVVNMDFNYDSGFKVGLGWNTSFDDWGFYAEYTWYHKSDKHSSTLPTTASSLSAYWVNEDNNYTSESDKWDVDLDMIDVEMARAAYTGTKLTMKPFLGIRGGWLDQKFNATYVYNANNFDSQNKSDSWFVGPRVGMDSNWIFAEGFRAYADVAASLFYQKFKVRTNQTTTSILTQTNIPINLKNSKGYINPCFEIGLGLGWGTYFDNSNWHFDLSAGYEMQHFWNQNMMRDLVDMERAKVDGNPGNLVLHGLTATARLDF